MNALETIQLVVEGRAPEGWATAGGVYGNFSKWPHEAVYYAKCPKCGLIHGNFKTMREAHAKKLCNDCNLDAINAIKDQVYDVVHDPDHKPKEMAKIVKEDVEPFDPFDTPPEPQGVPIPPEDDPDFGVDTKSEIERLLLGNWLDVALRGMAADLDCALTDLTINEHWSERHGNYDPSNMEETTAVEIEAPGSTYLLFKNHDEAEKYAIERVSNDLNDEPGIFTQSWLKDFINEERLKDAIGDPYEDWENEVRDLDYPERLEKMVDAGYVESDDGLFYKNNGDPRIETTARAKALEAYVDSYVEKEKPTVDPWEWLRDVYGEEDATKHAIEMAGIDIPKAAQSAVDTDGVAHFLAHYDHNQNELENDAVYYRTN